jgi:hypothetical protein
MCRTCRAHKPARRYLKCMFWDAWYRRMYMIVLCLQDVTNGHENAGWHYTQGSNRVLVALKPVATAAALVGVWWSHAMGLVPQTLTALLIGAAIGWRGLRRGSLNASGR